MIVEKVRNDVLTEETGIYLSTDRSADVIFYALVPQNDVERELLNAIAQRHAEAVISQFSQRVVRGPLAWSMSSKGIVCVTYCLEVNGVYHEQNIKFIIEPDGRVLPCRFRWKETAKKNDLQNA